MAAPMDLYDNSLLGIIQHVGEIQPFLDVVFNFLLRRTDFYRIMHNREDKMGFPPGVARQMVMQTFTKYEQYALQMMQREDAEKNKRGEVAPPAVETVEVQSEDPISVEKPTDKCEEKEQKTSPAKPSQESKPKAAESGHPAITTGTDSYNGAALDNYSWSQSFTDVDIKVPIPTSVKKGKDVKVDITSDRISVSLKPGVVEKDEKVLMAGKLKYNIKREDSMWSLEPGNCIQINLEKTMEKMWLGVLEGDPEIKQDTIDPTRHLHDMDDDSQAGWRQAMFDFQQKQQGKPTSKELETHGILKKAWDAEGSPFKGTEFDPSKLNIST
ncbi:nudC domain-containing protein 3-like [Saccoglossus kowalevskii]|uniref:NudC domain-containing protein 3-like n=1 Tax=Saccoglossus kowalevskii TaxID=10224 RepID=A0ABM0GMM5_SACKO|nr:PREDICTED: nudC domain-containing protein 3-like [Saccoglossus kowalevskii]